jgi:transposase
MCVCIVSQDGELLLHRNMQAAPEPFLKAVAPSREGLVVAVECLFPWYWLADRCAEQGLPLVLGHALYMKAIHGGKAKHDKIDSPKIAARLRGGMRPQASVSPAARRATRDLLRRRTHLMRKRAELLGPVHNTNSQDNLPEIGKKIAYTANRAGVAERFEAGAVHKTIAVDLALIPSYDQLLNDLALFLLRTAKLPDAQTLSLLQPVPGLGKLRRLVLLYASHDIHRCPRGQAFASSCRLVKCAKASGEKRVGTAGNQLGWPGWSKSMTQAKPSVSWRTTSPGRSIVCANAAQPLLWSIACVRKGAERGSPTPNSPLQGGACTGRT